MVLGGFCVPKGLCMVIGGIRHQEQRFNSRSAGVSSALLFLSVGGELGTGLSPGLGVPPGWVAAPCAVPAGVFAPTLFSKVYGKLVCGECHNVTQNPLGHYLCHNCHFDLVSGDLDPQQGGVGVRDALSPPGSRAGWWQWGCPLYPR